MKLSRKNLLLVSFMLFSLFFGAGNLIFPPFLGQNAGANTPVAWFGFLITAVVLPVLGVVAVAKFNGLEQLSRRVNPVFAMIFTVVIYLSIGPGLGIPRAASVPFEMAISPLLPNMTLPELPNGQVFNWPMLVYSAVFFLIAGWLALSPKKLVNRIGRFLTPSLLLLLTVIFVGFVVAGHKGVAPVQEAYQSAPFVKGFLEGYNTMDAIAALNFGLVIATTLKQLNVKDDKSVIKYTVKSGAIAGTILAVIYGMLSFIGMNSAGVCGLQENGALTLRYIVADVFGAPGAIILAVTFTLACLTTCVGLITSISQYFETLTKKVKYQYWVVTITVLSFLICNLGLNKILSISVPVLNVVYPIAIVLIVLGLFDKYLKNTKFVYPVVIFSVTFASLVYSVQTSVETAGKSLGAFGEFFHKLPFYSDGMGWVTVALVALAVAVLLDFVVKKVNNKKQLETK